MPGAPLLLCALTLVLAASAPAQEEAPPLELGLQDRGRVEVRLGDVLGDPALREALHSGLPLRLEVVTELWKDGFFDTQMDRDLWRATVVYDPLERRYLLELPEDSNPRRSASSLARLSEELPHRRIPSLRPEEEGRYYYLARIEIETLSLSDLEELRRWLRGDLAEVLREEGGVEGAVERGLRRGVVRLLGMPARRFETRTTTFRFAPDGSTGSLPRGDRSAPPGAGES